MKFKIVKNPKGGFDLVAGDKVLGHFDNEQAATEALQAAQGDDGDEDLDARIQSAVKAALGPALNGALKDHLKRELPKAIGDAVAAALPKPDDTGTQPDPKTGQQGAGKPDPELVKLRERLEQQERKTQESDARAKAIEEKSRKESARAELMSALDAKGIKGARAKALASHLEATGALRFTEDGKPELVVSRARMKGGKAEELAFDIANGVDDWTKTDDAKDFLPPPSTGPQPRGQQPPGDGVRRAAPVYAKPATTDNEMARRAAESLTARGVDITDAYRR